MPGITQLFPGDIFAGDYRIVRSLKQGGMGSLYVAVQLATGVQRALKLMHADLLGDEQLLRLFKQEARIGALIKSDHVVRMIAAGVDKPTGTPWLAMELLDGEDLAARIRPPIPPLPHATVVEILSQVCDVLTAAHLAGVVHRDLKPENIFLTKPLGPGLELTVKILDFGIAKLIAASTARGTIAIGSPLWMAPEQSSGEKISAATDVWAIGLLAFRLLAGRVYWTRQLLDQDGLRYELLKSPLVSASKRAGEYGCSARIPPRFDAWFARCVARSSEDRFANAGLAREHLIDALRFDGVPPLLSPPPPRPSEPTIYPVGPPQPPGAAYDPNWYVPREREEKTALNYLKFPGSPAVLFGPEHFGKTWLLSRCLAQIEKQQTYDSIVVNFGLLDRSSLDELLKSLANRILRLRGLPPLSIRGGWKGPGAAMQKLTRWMELEVLPDIPNALVLALDDIDIVSGSPYQDDFFALLRSWAESHMAPWSKLRLVLAVSTTPAQLINDPNRSPFNLTTPIVLDDFSAAQVEDLARRYGLHWSRLDIQRVMALVAGHPTLVRLLMHEAALHETPLAELLDPGRGNGWILWHEMQRIHTWLRKHDLLVLTARIAQEPTCSLAVEEVHRLVRARVIHDDPSGRPRLRHELYAHAARLRA